MEVRLNTRKKIKQFFTKLSITNDLSFKKLFKPALSKKILLHYLDEIEKRRSLLLDYNASDVALLADLILSNPALSPRKILLAYGVKQALDCVGHRELRAMFAACDKKCWYRLMADVKKVQIPAMQRPFKIIREQLMLFKPLSIKQLKKRK
jgi:hypothetical protein